ncbi:MAG: Maf family protein [Symbiobacteriaceae bacterium]|nr:Maf family protein [Symbiobacteriaceae bacterium]
MAVKIPIILASASPRRRDLLARYNLPFIVDPSRYEEEEPALKPEDMVLYLAHRKADEVASRRSGLIIAADTVVSLDDQIMGKPKDAEAAAIMLHALSGRCHQVFTGIVLLNTATGRSLEAVEKTSVWFRSLPENEMMMYIQSGEYVDKAGSYAAQGMAATFISRIEGCYHNVIGLPLSRLDSLLNEFGISLIQGTLEETER